MYTQAKSHLWGLQECSPSGSQCSFHGDITFSTSRTVRMGQAQVAWLLKAAAVKDRVSLHWPLESRDTCP